MSSSPLPSSPVKTTPGKAAQREKKTIGLSPLPSTLTHTQTYHQANLKSKIADLESQVSAAEKELGDLNAKLKNPDAAATVKHHIKLLHDYNEIRDVGQNLMGLIADGRGERVGVIQEEFGMGTKD